MNEPGDKKQHPIETLNIIDVGTSILVDNRARTDYNAETTIRSLVATFQREGLPRQITFDRDPRFVASASSRDYPSALVRLLTSLEIGIDISPPHTPEHNGFVERHHRTYQEEGIDVYQPATEEQVHDMNADFRFHDNYQRPNQAITCHNQPPRVAFADLPPRPTLPEVVDPDRWLTRLNGHVFKRRVSAAGSVKVDKHTYYLSRALSGRYVVLQVDAPAKQFRVDLDGQPFKQLAIKGLHGHPMTFDAYLELISAEAYSEWRQYQAKSRRYLPLTA